MYRDDTCAACGESLPPDHLYCREHAATVDERLHGIAELLPHVADDLGRLADLLAGIHDETWDFLADTQPGQPEWPPLPDVRFRADAEDVEVDVDSEPGMVQVCLQVPASTLLEALRQALGAEDFKRLGEALASAHGFNATH